MVFLELLSQSLFKTYDESPKMNQMLYVAFLSVDVLIPLETIINLTLAKVPPIGPRNLSTKVLEVVYQKLAHSSAK